MPTNEYALPPALLPGGPAVGDTQLSISTWGQLIFQARGLTQTFEPIQAAQQMDRDAYGDAIDLSNPAFQKYLTRVTCTDVRPPPFDMVWPGTVFEVSSATFLAYAIGNPGSPGREEVSGSSFSANGFVFYRPYFPRMMMKTYSWQREEWKANNGWNFTMEEV